jgi:hypothetical protein
MFPTRASSHSWTNAARIVTCSLAVAPCALIAQPKNCAIVPADSCVQVTAGPSTGPQAASHEVFSTPQSTAGIGQSVSPNIAEDTAAHSSGVQPIPQLKTNSDKFQLKQALIQSVNVTLFQHAWRFAWDPSMRYLLIHKPFFHDWGASYTDYHMDRWSDGDNFVVNDVGHPLEGAAYGRVFLQNDPQSFVPIAMHNGYWKSRFQSLAWMVIWSAQFEVGPLSETDLGNQGGFNYVNGCGTSLACLNEPNAKANLTNDTGWTDFIITPTVGLGWIIGEDAIDRFIVTPIARNHRILGGRVLRSALEPSRSYAALFSGKFPWMLPAAENNYYVRPRPAPVKVEDPYEMPLLHGEFGGQYTSISLPVLTSSCPTKACRQGLSGAGFNIGYNFTHSIGLDGTVNFLPAQQGTQAMTQGQFGVKLGGSWQRFGIYAKIRPGFIYYGNAWPGLGSTTPTNLTRFTWDFGGIVEIYTHRNGKIRIDAGTTVVRYLTDNPDPRMSQLGTAFSTQSYVNQGNFQLSTSYVYRF